MRRLLVLAVLAAAVLPAAPGTAATIVVGNDCGIVDAIKAANTNTPQGGCPAGAANSSVRDTVVLQPGATYTFTAPYAPEVGTAPEATALPHLTSVITIEGNGATLERSAAPGTPRFRLLRASAGNVIVNGLTLRGGDQTTGGGVGGGMYASSAFVTLNDVTAEDNRADTGGGLAGTSPFTLNRVSVRRNAATLTRAGGLLLLATSEVRDSTIADNTAASHGGGIVSELVPSQSLTLLRSTVSGNEAGYGGGLHLAGPTVIGNSTISGNRATYADSSEWGGAGIYISGFGTTTITNATLADNRAAAAGQAGGIFLGFGTVELANTIVIGNTSAGVATGAGVDCKLSFWGGTFTSSGNNVFGVGTGCPTTGPADRFAEGGQAFTAVLRPLAVYPPGTMQTHRLQRLSPALDGGNDAICAAAPIDGIDQRGVSRIENSPCDVGAYEAQRADLSLTGPADVGRPTLGTDVTLTFTVQNVGPSPATGVQVRAPIPEGLALVSSGTGYDPGSGVWTVGNLARDATATLSIVARVNRYAVFKAEVVSLDQEDPDSVPANDAAGEDDIVRVAVTPPGIWVNTTLEAARDDGLCNVVEAVFAAETDAAPFATPGECTAGSGADTIHLQPSARYISTDVWFSGDAFPSVGSAITIEGNGASIERGITPKFFRAMQVWAGGALTLRNLSMHYFETRDETCGGAIHVSFGSLVLDNVFLSQNRVRNAYMGGAAICNVHGRLTASNSRIEDNTADVSESFFATRGGGITTNGEPAITTLTNTSVRNNVVTSGSYASGAGLEVVNGATLHLNGGTVRGNRIVLTGLDSQGYGGGINAEGAEDPEIDPAVVSITGTTLSENRVEAVGEFRTAFGGGLSVRLGSATLVDAIVGGATAELGNRAVGGGGGIYVASNADLGALRGAIGGNTAPAGLGGGGIMSLGGWVDLRQVELSGNVAGSVSGSGGAVRSNGRLTIHGGSIWGNTATHGGGIANDFGTLELTDGLIFNNTAHHQGGGIVIQRGSGSATIVNTQIASNTAGVHGGGIVASVPTQLTNSTVTGNRLVGGSCIVSSCPAGGGIHMINEALTVTDSEVSSNNALVPGASGSSGGGIWSNAGVSLTRSRVSQNAARFGGGLSIAEGELDSLDTTFDLNNAFAGGALNLWKTTATVERSTIDGNRASESGGGVSMDESTLTLWNATVSRNVSENLAGAIYHGYEATLTVFASTITGNGALKTGGIYSFKTNGGQILASILAGNQSQESEEPDCDADSGSPPPSGGWNVLGRGGGCQARSDLDDRLVNDDTVATEVLFPLADNGGATLTHALRPSSPALDAVTAGVCNPEDQRRLTRPKDGDGDGTARCDSGAVEHQSVHQAPLVLQGINPSVRPANTFTPVVAVQGTGFTPESKIRVGGAPRLTEWRTSQSMYVFLEEADTQSTVDIKTVPITVHRQDGTVSNPVPLTLVRPGIDTVQSGTAVAGSSASVSAFPTTIGLGGSVAATLTNNGGNPATVTVATYMTNPTTGSAFSAGGFVDVQVTGADLSDRVTVTFYYPLTIQGAAERQLELRFWTGTQWRTVRGQGGARPAKDTTDNPDGTGMGGKFTVTLGNTSTPKITELSGTVLGTDLDSSAPSTTASVSPGAMTSGWHGGDATVTLEGVDDVGVASTEWSLNGGGFQAYTGPFLVSLEGSNTIRYRSTDELGNVEAERSIEVRIDKTAPNAAVAALPATRPARFTVSWSGSDAGSGIASYDVYVSTNGGPFVRFQTATTATSAMFTGLAGRSYGFAAVATDRVGHAEPGPTAAEATTRVPPVVKPKPKPKPKKVTLCHKGRTIKVPKSQVAKHRKHRDKLRACPKKKKPKRR